MFGWSETENADLQTPNIIWEKVFKL